MDPFLAPDAQPATADDGRRNSPCIGIVMNTFALMPVGAAEGPGDDDEDDDSPGTGGGGGGNIDPDDDDYGDDEDDDDDGEDPLWARTGALRWIGGFAALQHHVVQCVPCGDSASF